MSHEKSTGESIFKLHLCRDKTPFWAVALTQGHMQKKCSQLQAQSQTGTSSSRQSGGASIQSQHQQGYRVLALLPPPTTLGTSSQPSRVEPSTTRRAG